MIPSGPKAKHYNFPELFISPEVEHILIALQEDLAGASGISEIVLNFEKCHWFEVFPLAQLMTILVSHHGSRPELHVVGPSLSILPYFFPYVARAKKRLQGNLPEDERLSEESKVRWYSEVIPQLRLRAGAFLVSWGVFDLLEEYWPDCYWYSSRDTPAIALTKLRDLYLFGYGSNTPAAVHDSDRVWPFTVISRPEQDEIMERINGEELIAGALHRHARNDVIADGTAQNVLFFEPYENIFQHAFPAPTESDLGLVVMRVTDWMFNRDGTLTNKAKWLLSKLPDWEREYVESLGTRGAAFMEIIIADCGQGIPAALSQFMLDDEDYCQERKIQGFDLAEMTSASWEVIRYAFQPHTTSKAVAPPGKRGLAWIQDTMSQLGGMVQVVSNGASYVLADYGKGLLELPLDRVAQSNPPKRKAKMGFLSGTYIRIIFPLKGGIVTTPERRPRWSRSHPEPTLFTEQEPKVLLRIQPSEELVRYPRLSDWDEFFKRIVEQAVNMPFGLYVIDFGHQAVTRWALEYMFESFIKATSLHGRVVVINCSRQVACRLDTVTSVGQLSHHQLVLPVFETSLRLYWAGAPPEIERILLKWFQQGPSAGTVNQLEDIATANSGYFIFDNNQPLELSFSVEEIEKLIRESLGRLLEQSLERRGALNRGRYVMPLSDKAVSTFVEPHQIFADGKVANLLCSHLAVLLRWRYSPLVPRSQEQRVLTATRIGRDIAMRMPEAYPHKRTFIYFDYHLVHPDKPRLIKHLAGSAVVIVLDIITTGSQVEELVRICEDAGCQILGIVSFIDFSPNGSIASRVITLKSGDLIEHKTFLRSPQEVTKARPTDKRVDKQTFSLSPPPEIDEELEREGLALLSRDRGLRFLEDAEAVHYGHYELFGHHFDFVVNFGRLLTNPSLQRDEILRACESVILGGSLKGSPTAIVLYPDLSNAHILQGSLERRYKLRKLVNDEKLVFVEARRGSRARGRRYWLTKEEIEKLTTWAKDHHGDKYSITIIDDQAMTGETLIALLDLARELKPDLVSVFVLVNQMPHVTTYHHQGIERFIWATNNFSCLIHLNLPVFTRDNCPLCHERDLLLREYRGAKSDWFRQHIEVELQKVEMTTALHPQDSPEGLLGASLEGDVEAFSWEDEKLLPGSRRSVISRALSVRMAINDGIPLLKILTEVSNQPNDDLWRLTVIEIARRADLHLAQRAETDIKRFFFRTLRGRIGSRRLAALEALRYMRPEILLPEIDVLVNAGLSGDLSEEFSAELLLLMRRVFFYRHLPTSLAFEKELVIARKLDDLSASATPGGPIRQSLDRIIYEWGSGPEPLFELVTVVQKLEAVLMTSYRPEHRLLFELAEYISDEREDVDSSVRAALEKAVRASSLGKMLASVLHSAGYLRDEALPELAADAYKEARELRRWIEEHMRGIKRTYRERQEKLEELKDLIGAIETELKALIVDPWKVLGDLHNNFMTHPPTELHNVELKVGIHNQVEGKCRIIVDQSLFQSILRNLFSNLRHSIDARMKIVEADFSLHQRSNSQICLSVLCKTRASKARFATERSTTSDLLLQGELYAIEHSLHDVNKQEVELGWYETWSFRRL